MNNETSIPDFSRGVPCDSFGPVLPVIAQDAADDRVLMLAWMNEEAFRETMSSGYAVYFSRSRKKLWRKGETSGHRQRVTDIRVDCDADAILVRVEQTGAACHEGYQSCFFRSVDADRKATVRDERLVDPEDVYGKSS